MPTKKQLPTNGWYRCCVGLTKRLDGALVGARFYTSKDLDQHEKAKAAIKARWLEIRASGLTYWSSAEIQKLEDAGIIQRRDKKIDGAIAKSLLADISINVEPLTEAEIQPFVDENGSVKPDAAPQATDFVSRKVFGRLDVRSKFFNTLYTEAMRDPIGTFERCSRLFGWTGAQTSFFLGLTGGASASPIAFDASENKGKNVLDLLEDDVKVKSVDGGAAVDKGS